MISAETAIRTARGLIGTPYSELDCINLIKKVIRTAPGGDSKYTTAGTNDLWNSDSKRGKYRDLTWKQEGISGAKPGMLAFMGTGDVNHVGLVTDAGTPAISDPGTALVRAAAESGIPVLAVSGPSACVSAVSVSGFDFSAFTFYGFLPREKKELREKLLQIGRKGEGAVFHESPHRVKTLVAAIADTLPGARLSVSCDLTKLHELTLRGAPEEILARLEENEKSEKGEYCVVADLRQVKLPEEAPVAQTSLEARLFEGLLRGESLRAAMQALISAGEKKNAVYAASLRVKALLDA